MTVYPLDAQTAPASPAKAEEPLIHSLGQIAFFVQPAIRLEGLAVGEDILITVMVVDREAHRRARRYPPAIVLKVFVPQSG